MFEIQWTETAKEQYESLAEKIKKQVDKALERIAKQPMLGKPLRGELKGIFSERVSTFRVLYKVNKSDVVVIVLVIEHRRTVYGGH